LRFEHQVQHCKCSVGGQAGSTQTIDYLVLPLQYLLTAEQNAQSDMGLHALDLRNPKVNSRRGDTE
jgi:hypothetical protein